MSDEETIGQIIIGCAKSVIASELQWYRKRVRPRRPSRRKMALVSIFWPSLKSSDDTAIKNGFRPFPYVKSRLDSLGLEEIEVDPPAVNRAAKTSLNLGFHQKEVGKPRDDELSGPNTVYMETDRVLNLKKLATELKPRAIIYLKLRHSGFLERNIRVCNYVKLIRRRHIGVKDAVKVEKAYASGPILNSEIEAYEKRYLEVQKILKQKNNKEIFLFACKRTRKELSERDKVWHSDETYTTFFIDGGIAYSQVQIIYPTW